MLRSVGLANTSGDIRVRRMIKSPRLPPSGHTC